jgi:hypothetical protein
MALHLKDILENDPCFDPKESFSFIRIIERGTSKYASLYGKLDTATKKRDSIWLGLVLDETKHLFYLDDLGVFEFSMADGYKPRPDYAYGIHRQEKYRLQYGNFWVYEDLLKKSGLDLVINNINPEFSDTLNALLIYKLTEPTTANYRGLIWFENSYAKLVYVQASLSSGAISTFLANLGQESNYRNFFQLYLNYMTSNVKMNNLLEFPILIDSTGLPNDIKIPITSISNHNGDINNEIRVIYVTDKESGFPIFFKYIAGNIVDVSTLEYVISTVKMFNIDIKSVTLDAGYNSIDNLEYLSSLNITFVTRMQENRTEFKNIISEYSTEIYNPLYLV